MNIKDAIFGAQSLQKLAAASDDLQGSLPIADIDRGIIYTRDGGLVGLFEVLPMNFFLQSTAERVRIVGALAAWLKIAPSSVQILGLSQPVDVEQYTRRMHQYAADEADASCRACIEDNIEQVCGMIQGGAFITRFFVAYRFEPDMAPAAKTLEQRADALYQIADTAKGYLARCGLTVAEPQYIDNQMVETVFGMLCKQTSRNIKLPVDFRLMMEDCFGIPTESNSEDDEEPTNFTEEAAEIPHKKKRRKKRRKAKKNKQTADQSDGITRVMDLICPSAIDMTHRDYLVIDGVCHAYLYIAGYGYQSLVRGGWLAALVGMGDGISLSTTLLRRPREKILPKVANSTIWSRSRMRDVDDTRADYEQMGSAIYAGQYIKQQMNTANEDYYDMYTLIEVTAATPELLHTRLAEVERLCSSQDIICKRCDYVEEQAFHSFLPVVSLAPEIARKARRNTLLSGAAAAFPFYSMELCEQNGILIGEDLRNHAVCMLDIFDGNRYSNANMTVLGMSGAGKSATRS